MTTDSHLRIASDSASRRDQELTDRRVRGVLRRAGRHLATLSGCHRTSDRNLVDNIAAFTADRHVHTYPLDSRAIIAEIEALGVDAVPMTMGARDLLAALHSYLADLEGILIIEPPAFALPRRQMDLRCIAFFPEVEAFNHRIEELIGVGALR